MDIPDFSPAGLLLETVPEHPGWYRGPLMEIGTAKEMIPSLRPLPAAQPFHVLAGGLLEDWGYRIYLVPLRDTARIVADFEVGQHGEISYGFDPLESRERITQRLLAVEKICPFAIASATDDGLLAEFTRPLTEEEAEKIESLFPIDDATLDGLDIYLSDWSGDGPFMVPLLLEEQALRLWWD
jgi:hypothetical protein